MLLHRVSAVDTSLLQDSLVTVTLPILLLDISTIYMLPQCTTAALYWIFNMQHCTAHAEKFSSLVLLQRETEN